MTSASGIQVDDKQARIMLSGMVAADENLSRPMAVISHKLANGSSPRVRGTVFDVSLRKKPT